ncbi:MAG: hypothetical protein RI926_627 [Actinomycetota bacterium]|jgi:hypothetical protein
MTQVLDITAAADITETTPAWVALKEAAIALQAMQIKDGSIPDASNHGAAGEHVAVIIESIHELLPAFQHDAAYLEAVIADLGRWVEGGFAEPDFLASILAFAPAEQRVDGVRHLVVFPMYTQNGSTNRFVEAVLVEVMWPEFISELEAGDYGNKMFLPLRFIDFTPGYDTNSAVLFPETVAMSEVPAFSWGAIFQDREAARFAVVTKAAAEITGLELPADAEELLTNQKLAEETFIMWDLIHDRTHMSGDLPFDPFMIKQRMPFFLYGLEELRCDLTAFRECVKIERGGSADPETRQHARLVQYAVVFDRIFRFSMTGTRVRNYDAVAAQLLFAWMHQHGVLHWTNNKLSIDWAGLPDVVVALGDAIDELYWRSIDRPKIAHWLAAYELVATTLTPHPASVWAKGADALPVSGELGELTNQLLDDEFPLSMFYEALQRKISPVIESTRGIRA